MVKIDMEMPSCCTECPVCDYLMGICLLMDSVPEWQKEVADNGNEKRASHCPLIGEGENQNGN